MRSNLKKTFWSTLCFVFFMILAAGSGCDGCSGGNYSYTNDEIDSIAVDSIEEPYTPQREAYEEHYYSDIDEEEREEEEIYQSETEDEVEESNDEDIKVDSIKLDSDAEQETD